MRIAKSNLVNVGNVILIILFLSLPFGLILFQQNELSYALLLLLIPSLILFLSYTLLEKRFELDEMIFYSIIFLGIFVMSIFPYSEQFQSYIVFAFSLILIFLFLSKVDIKNVLNLTLGNKKDSLFFKVFILLFLISVIGYNFKDFINIYGFFKIFYFIFGGLFLSVYIPNRILSDKIKIKRFFKVLFIIGFLSSIAGIITIFYSFHPTQKPGYAYGLFLNANTNAYLASFYIPVTLYALLYKKDIFYNGSLRNFYIIGLILMIINLLFSYSRGGYIGTATSSALLLFFYSKKRFISIIIILALFNSQLLPFLTVKGGSNLSRIGLLYAAFEMLKSSSDGFLWGFGTVSVFTKFELVKASLGGLFDPVNYPHNFILFYIMQFGIISLIPLIYFIGKYLFKSVKCIFKKVENRDEIIIYFTIVFSILMQSLVEDTILFPHFFVFPIFLVFFGMLRKNVNLNY